MGGDHLHCFASEDESSTLDDDDDYSVISSIPSSFCRDSMRMRDEDGSVSGSSGCFYEGFDDLGYEISSNSVEFDGTLRRRKTAYNDIMKNYADLWAKRESLYQAKSKILSYSPGSWITDADGKKLRNYNVPETTTLLLIGPKGSGKSSLVNRISRVFEHDKFSSERAQVTYNSSTGEGTFFLQEYMIPRGSSSFCLFDTRSLSENLVANDEMLQHWLTKGVRHGELVIRDSDCPSLKLSLKCKAQQSGTPSSKVRKVNFVVFVVNGLSVLRSMNSDKKEERRYMEMLTKTFSSPFLSYKDDKPVIVVTHGDLLSLKDRARVRVYLGEKLGVPPAKQIFDIPDNSDLLTELMILDMMRYSLEHADKHMPRRESRDWVDRTNFSMDRIKDEVSRTSIFTVMFMAVLLGIACLVLPVRHSHQHDNPLLESARTLPSKFIMDYPYEPQEHYATFPNAESKYVVSHSQNRERQPQEPQATSSPTFPSKPSVKSHSSFASTSGSQLLAENQVRETKDVEGEDWQPQATPSSTSSSQFASTSGSQHLAKNQVRETREVEREDWQPQVTPSSTSSSQFASTSGSQHLAENQVRETRDAERENWQPQVTPSSTSSSRFVVEDIEPGKLEAEHKNLESEATSAQALPSKSIATEAESVKPIITSSPPTSRSGSNGQQRQPVSRPPSHQKKHPKIAVKWHKIRHLWLDN